MAVPGDAFVAILDNICIDHISLWVGNDQQKNRDVNAVIKHRVRWDQIANAINRVLAARIHIDDRQTAEQRRTAVLQEERRVANLVLGACKYL